MSASSLKRRRSAAVQLADHAESCEVRVLLSGIAIYPAQAATKAAVPASTDVQASIVVLTPADYNGSWSMGGDNILTLVVKGNNPETAKVKGTVTTMLLAGGSAKFKGEITNGSELEGTTKGKIVTGPFTAKVKGELSIHLTDTTHFEGTGTTEIKGLPPSVASVTGVKL